MGITDVAAKKMLNFVLCGQAYNPPLPEKWKVCLEPEPSSADGYVNFELSRDASSWELSDSEAKISLTTPITFGPAIGDWGYITEICFRSEGGTDEENVHYRVPLVTPIRVNEGETLTIAPGGTYIERQ